MRRGSRCRCCSSASTPILRSTILDTINEDFVRTARAKGLSQRQVLLRHILP